MNIPISLPSNLIAKVGVKMLVYGTTGVGKTRGIVGMPNAVLIAVEDGLLSLNGEQVPVIDCRGNLGAVFNVVEWVKTQTQYQTVVWDSWSQVSTLLLKYFEANEKDGRQAYKKMADLLIKWTNELLACPCNVIFICKELSETTNTGIVYKPIIEGNKALAEIAHVMQIILHFQFKDVIENGVPVTKVVAVSKGSPYYMAKDRSGRLNAEETPNYAHLINKILSN